MSRTVFTFDHVGIAVASLSRSVAIYERSFRSAAVRVEELPMQGVEVAVISTSHKGVTANLELLTATHDHSPIGKFLARSGPGLHHLALRVDNLDSAIEQLRSQGFEVIGEPQRGAGECRFVFLHPRSTGGVLLEVLQRE